MEIPFRSKQWDEARPTRGDGPHQEDQIHSVS